MLRERLLYDNTSSDRRNQIARILRTYLATASDGIAMTRGGVRKIMKAPMAMSTGHKQARARLIVERGEKETTLSRTKVSTYTPASV